MPETLGSGSKTAPPRGGSAPPPRGRARNAKPAPCRRFPNCLWPALRHAVRPCRASRAPGAFRSPSPDRRATARPPQPPRDGLELIDGLALDFRRPSDADEFEFGAAQEPRLKFHRIIHEKLLAARTLGLRTSTMARPCSRAHSLRMESSLRGAKRRSNPENLRRSSSAWIASLRSQ